MTMRFHRGDLPADYQPGRPSPSTPKRWGSIRIATGSAWCRSRRATASADVVQIVKDAPRPRRLIRILADESVLKIFHYARFDLGGAVPRFRRHAAPGLLHQDRLAPDAHLYRPARPEGSRPGTARDRLVEAAAILRLGRRDLTPGADRLCGLRRAASARAQGEARRHARAREPARHRSSIALPSCRRGPSSTCSAGRETDIFAHC